MSGGTQNEGLPDGTWEARKIFTKRIPHTVDFAIEGEEFDLYREITRFVKRQSARAAAEDDNPRARAVGFLMALYQRRLASSTRAMRRSLENRANRLEKGLKQAQELVQTAPPTLPDWDELDEMEEAERERLERMLEAVTLAGNAEMVREEIAELHELAVVAKGVEESGVEAKLGKLKTLLESEGFYDHPERASSEVTRLRQNLETEAIAMKLVIEHERARGGQVEDISARNVGYDVTSLDTRSGEIRLIEVKGLSALTGTILLTPNERRVAEDRRACYWLYIVTNCAVEPVLQEPILDPARHAWNEVKKVQHYYLRVDAMTQPMQVREKPEPPYGGDGA